MEKGEPDAATRISCSTPPGRNPTPLSRLPLSNDRFAPSSRVGPRSGSNGGVTSLILSII